MMPPALLIVGIGRERRVPLPVPLFLLWPLLLLAYLGVGLWWLVTPADRRAEGPAKVLLALELSRRLSGLRVDIRSAADDNVSLRVY